MTAATRIAIAVVERDGSYLVGTRARGTVLEGHAEFPGGKMNPGESPDQAAIRECLEETGLVVRIRRPLKLIEHTYPHATVELHFMLCESTADAVEPQAPFRWVHRTELLDLNFPAANQSVVQELVSETR